MLIESRLVGLACGLFGLSRVDSVLENRKRPTLQVTEAADSLCSLVGPSVKQGRLAVDEAVRARLFQACDGVRDTLRRAGVRVEDDVGTKRER